jgi:hypothetical protein
MTKFVHFSKLTLRAFASRVNKGELQSVEPTKALPVRSELEYHVFINECCNTGNERSYACICIDYMSHGLLL